MYLFRPRDTFHNQIRNLIYNPYILCTATYRPPIIIIIIIFPRLSASTVSQSQDICALILSLKEKIEKFFY